MMQDTPDAGAERDPSFDAHALYREDTYTDRKIGTIRVMTPVTADGGPDASRQVEYTGQISVMTPMGTLPVAFELPGPTLAEAAAAFTAEAKAAIERTMQELQQLRREAASGLVIPGAGGGMDGMGGMGGGGLGGGGRLRMP